MYSRLQEAVASIRKITNFVPLVGVVLGSGLNEFASDIRILGKVPYKKIPGFPVSTVEGHNGQFVFGYVEKVPVVLMDGRVHYYEGYSMEDVVMPVRVMAMLGAKRIILTNAAGGINKGLYEGALMMITDQITSFVPSPLIGPNLSELGTRFPDMSNVYDKKFRELAKNVARNNQIILREGVYLQTTGPNYETPAEIKMFELLGADAVGMSTACEAMVLNHMNIPVLGISCITNMASGISKNALSHDEVKRNADAVSEKFRKLIWNIILAVDSEEKALKKEKKDAKKEDKKEKKPEIDEINFDDFDIIQF